MPAHPEHANLNRHWFGPWKVSGRYFKWDLHRVHGPAIEFSSGRKEWFLCGQRHRGDGPSIEGADGFKTWHKEGRLTRKAGW